MGEGITITKVIDEKSGGGCRQLVVGGSWEQLRALHSALQSGLAEACEAGAALPLLECALMDLETAGGGGRRPKGAASQVPYYLPPSYCALPRM